MASFKSATIVLSLFALCALLALSSSFTEAATLVANGAEQPEAAAAADEQLNEAESADSGAAEALRDFDDDGEPSLDEPREQAGSAGNQIASLDNNQSQDSDDDSAEASNIANAKIDVSSQDLATAAGHHHHHGHYPHGMLKMGAHTGKKGSFGWHDKHPVGGKGRR